MNTTDMHVGDVGTLIEVTLSDNGTVVDVSGAVVKNFIFRKPGGAVVSRAAGYVTDGTDGKLRYVTIADDLDHAGSWILQVFVETSGGKWHSSTEYFEVLPNVT